MSFHRTTGLLATALLTPYAAPQSTVEPEVFDLPVVVVTDIQQRLNALLDLDGDGWADAVGTFMPDDDTGGVYAYLNDGSGGLQLLFEDTWPQNADNDFPFPVATADWTGDGLDDFLVGLRDDVRMYVSTGASAPAFQTSVHLSEGEVAALALGDYDGDGVLELAVRRREPNGTDEGIAIYDGLAGVPVEIATAPPIPGTGNIMRNFDLGADGVMDLVCINTRADFFTLSGNTLNRVLSQVTNLGAGGMGDAGDVDGDGDEDLALFSVDGRFRVFRQGPGGLVLEPIQFGGPATDLADADGDGDLDGVCCGGSGGGTTTFLNTKPSNFEIAWNDGTGVFEPSFQLPAMGSNAIAGVADMDRDGDPDLVAGRVVYYNQDGFEPLSELTDYWVGSRGLGDLDGDGDPDLGSDHTGYERNSADGWFETYACIVPTLPAGSTLHDPGVQADFDGDGDLDVMFSELQGGVPAFERLFLNTGGGGFVDGGPVTAPGVVVWASSWTATHTGDLNGDGRLDLTVRDWDSSSQQNSTRVFTQAADGTFDLVNTLVGEGVSLVEDLDQDGADDLLTYDRQDIWIRYGDPAASLSAVQTFPQPTGSLYSPGESFAAGDLDSDGLVDLVVTKHDSPGHSVRILRNQGNRQFEVIDDALPGVLVSGAQFALADVDQDGALDLLASSLVDPVTGSWDRVTSIFLGSPGTIAFTDGPANLYPTMTAVEDLDGDGDPDLVCSHGQALLAAPNTSLDASDSGAREQFGSATPGLGGQAPTLGAVGPFVAGGTVELRVTGAAPGAQGVLFVGKAGQTVLPVLGATLEVDPGTKVPFVAASLTGEWGSGAYTHSVRVPPALAGRSLVLQALLYDPAGQGGGTATNALRLTFAP